MFGSEYPGEGVALVMAAVFGVAALRYLAKARRRKRAGVSAVASMDAFKIGLGLSMILVATAIWRRFML